MRELKKICEMTGVRAYDNGPEPVELWFNESNKHLVIVTFSEGGSCATQIDLFDVIEWIKNGHAEGIVIDYGGNTPGT
jgi:hypothetical protein